VSKTATETGLVRMEMGILSPPPPQLSKVIVAASSSVENRNGVNLRQSIIVTPLSLLGLFLTFRLLQRETPAVCLRQ
jgi:hypothetical protein